MADDEYIVIRKSPDGDGCLTAIVCLILFGLYAWFRSWFDDYAPHSPVFKFIGAFYHYAAAIPLVVFGAFLQLTPYPRFNVLLGVLGFLAIPGVLLWLWKKQQSFSQVAQSRLSVLWVILRFTLLALVAPILIGIAWLLILGIWNLLLLIVKWLFEKG